MRKKVMAIYVALIFAAATLVACAEEPEYVGVCVNPETEERLPDNYCDDDDPNYLPLYALWWMSMNSSHRYPAVGERVNRSYFKTTLPKGTSYTKGGLSKSGGSSVKSWSSSKSGSSWGSSKSGGSSWGSSKSGGSSWGSSGGSRSGRR